MADTGATYPQTAGTDGTGVAWGDYDNIKVEAGYAYAILTLLGLSEHLRASNFGFSIPSGATIDGVLAEINLQANSANKIKDIDAFLVDENGSNFGDDQRKDEFFPTSPTTWEYGGSTDKWGASLTPAIINDVDFGVRFKVKNESVTTSWNALVYFIRLTVYYTEEGVSGKKASFFQML